MKIFISCVKEYEDIGLKLLDELSACGHEVMLLADEVVVGNQWTKTIYNDIRRADAFIVIIGEQSLRSDWFRTSLWSLMLSDISQKQYRIIPIVLDKVAGNSPLPGQLFHYCTIDVSKHHDKKSAAVASLFRLLKVSRENTDAKRVGSENITGSCRDINVGNDALFDENVSRLHSILVDGQLTLVCGAGVSVDANGLTWSDMLYELLNKMVLGLAGDNLEKFSCSDFREDYAASPLILGKILKNNFKNDLVKEIKSVLYNNNPKPGKIISSIVDMASPPRDGRSLDSIITFNYDNLIESALRQSSIAFNSVYREGYRCNSKEVPVYHVHGYIPESGDGSDAASVVFSEDVYHNQFSDSFSWSNIIQINKYTSNTCLFVGVSLMDPNLRRLLDVAKRKNADGGRVHFIIKKRRLTSDAHKQSSLYEFLEEQDANELGLNVIWVSSFEEISDVLSRIAGNLSR